MDLKEIEKNTLEKLQKISSKEELSLVEKEYTKEINSVFKTFGTLSIEEKKEKGNEINIIKKRIEEIISEKKNNLHNNVSKGERIDITIPVKKREVGHLHPLTQIQREVEGIFKGMGFSVAGGPLIEDEKHNFDDLNIPADHPARDNWDTFWLDNGKLLRTHTSPVQIRYMKNHKPPFRIIAPGRVFRYEATDNSHEMNFYHVEGLMIDKDITVGNFKAIIEEFLKRLFGNNVNIRLRPNFFPFTEPSFEIDFKRDSGWLELMGAGMVHPNVLKNCGVEGQGFAFGIGLDRIAMIKYGMEDVRDFYKSDLRFLKQF